MAAVHLVGATHRVGEWFDYPRRRILESYGHDAHGTHRIVERPEEADVVLISTNHTFTPVGLGVTAEKIFRRHLSRCVVSDSGDYPSPIIGGLCASWSRRDVTPGLAAGWCYHHPNAAEASLSRQAWPDAPPHLWSFVGSKTTHPLRAQIARVDDPEGFVEDTSQTSLLNLTGSTTQPDRARFIAHYTSVLANSAFVVCPRGRGPSSMRIFEAMRAGRAPVIISDDWTPPPFVDWSRCSLRLPEREMGRLPDFVREHRADARAMGERANQEWTRVFGPAGLFHHTVEVCLALVKSRPKNYGLQALARCVHLLQEPWRREVMRWFKQRMFP